LCKIKCVLDAIICFIVVAAICRNVPCILGSSCLMAFSVSVMSSLM
jgi:hypothetical protein